MLTDGYPPRPAERAAAADLIAREATGVARYGTVLLPHNGRDALLDAYEEALDLACYLRQVIAERDAAAGVPVAPYASIQRLTARELTTGARSPGPRSAADAHYEAALALVKGLRQARDAGAGAAAAPDRP